MKLKGIIAGLNKYVSVNPRISEWDLRKKISMSGQPRMVAQDGLASLHGLGPHKLTRGGASPTPWAVNPDLHTTGWPPRLSNNAANTSGDDHVRQTHISTRHMGAFAYMSHI